jgi:hypothetical protein
LVICFRNKYPILSGVEHSGNESLHFPMADAEQVGLLDQLPGLPDQLTDAQPDLVERGREVQADLVERGIMDQLLGLVPVISCILITLREASTKLSAFL